MTHTVLQRVVVRMLYDPAFQKTVLADPERALAGLQLAAEERRWLLAAEPRAFRTDPLRRARSLRALLEEYPASAALAAASLGSVQALDRFFSAPEFHAAVQDRGSLAIAFGHYLQGLELADLRLRPLAGLEAAIAELRRASAGIPAVSSGPRRLRLSPRARVLELPGATLQLYHALRTRLAHVAADPVEALLHPKFRLRSVPALRGTKAQFLLVSCDQQGAGRIEEVPPALARLLLAAREPRLVEELFGVARQLGADPGEDREIVEDLVRDGLLAEA